MHCKSIDSINQLKIAPILHELPNAHEAHNHSWPILGQIKQLHMLESSDINEIRLTSATNASADTAEIEFFFLLIIFFFRIQMGEMQSNPTLESVGIRSTCWFRIFMIFSSHSLLIIKFIIVKCG